ncbi:hypothetical protein [Listeria valentina]|uniref:hypothetical protein n=1 Tax=Listeria valentina TaxID=2705293 RepID=UPI001431BDBA|nr:hypothetical protein [Listeria valentina]
MYGDTYQRERAKAMGDTNYESQYQLKLVQEKLQKKDLSASERSTLLSTESELKKQIQLKILQQDAKSDVKQLVEQSKEELPAVQKEQEKAENELKAIQEQLAVAFEAKTGEAIQKWLKNMRKKELDEADDQLKTCQKSFRLD